MAPALMVPIAIFIGHLKHGQVELAWHRAGLDLLSGRERGLCRSSVPSHGFQGTAPVVISSACCHFFFIAATTYTTYPAQTSYLGHILSLPKGDGLISADLFLHSCHHPLCSSFWISCISNSLFSLFLK